jgi:Synergist-CTERM protein sorting domain-containing protein
MKSLRGRLSLVAVLGLSVLAVGWFLSGSIEARAAAKGLGITVGSSAPLNPDFVRYQAEVKLGRLRGALAGYSDHPLGGQPDPFDLSHLKGVRLLSRGRGDSFPVSYDLRTEGVITPVKNQDPFGTCWTFGTMASLESTSLKLLLNPDPYDFSEYHLAYYTYVGDDAFDQTDPGFGDNPIFDQGGSIGKSTAILSRWTGPVFEADAPYDTTGESIPRSKDLARVHVSDALYLSGGYGNGIVRDDIKSALREYGAVAVRILWNGARYSAANASYYNSDGDVGSGHIVTIVGWDDNYSKANFASSPVNDGAWIVKNSWSSLWGKEGYFYLSYEDASQGYAGVFFAQPASRYDRVYFYDPMGWIGQYGYGSETAWCANVFTAQASENLKAIGFYTLAANTRLRISVYTDVAGADPTSGTLRIDGQVETLGCPGFHTILLSEPVPLATGKKFSVAVEVVTPGYSYPIPYEYASAGYTSKATASPGQSYVSHNGSAWTDLTTWKATANVCLKAYADDGVEPSPSPTPEPPTDLMVSGRVTFQGRGVSGDNWVEPMALVLLCKVNGIWTNYAASVRTDPTGVFSVDFGSVSGLDTGSLATVWIKGVHSLATARSVDLTSEEAAEMGVLSEGDVSASVGSATWNWVDMLDFSALAGCFGAASEDEAYVVSADLNVDGRVSIRDFTLLAMNFDRNGAPIPAVLAGTAADDAADNAVGVENSAVSESSGSSRSGGCDAGFGGAMLLAALLPPAAALRRRRER